MQFYKRVEYMQMKTEIIELLDVEKPDEKYRLQIHEAGEIIKQGGLVAFPTETVYGLGGDALNSSSSEKIYRAKGRPSDNPLIIHIAKKEDVYSIADHISASAETLMNYFWPGPLTIIFEKKDIVPFETTGGLNTVAVRMPNHPVALDFIREAGGFVAAPSANQSGKPSPTIGKYVIEDMDGKIDRILISDTVDIGVESTIIDSTSDVLSILRPGFITKDMISDVLSQEKIIQVVQGEEVVGAPKAPGMKYRHYAPKGDLLIVEGEVSQVKRRIHELLLEAKHEGNKTGVIVTDKMVEDFEDADCVKNIGNRDNPLEIAYNLYRVLRELDEEGVTKIYSESFASEGFGQAVMNRLLKAAGNHVEIMEDR